MERLRGMYEHSELVLFLQGPNQTAALIPALASGRRMYHVYSFFACKERVRCAE